MVTEIGVAVGMLEGKVPHPTKQQPPLPRHQRGLELLWCIICWGWWGDEGNISSEAILVFTDYTLYGFVLAYHAPLICAQISLNCIFQDGDSIPLLDLVLLWFRLKANAVDKLDLSMFVVDHDVKKTRLWVLESINHEYCATSLRTRSGLKGAKTS